MKYFSSGISRNEPDAFLTDVMLVGLFGGGLFTVYYGRQTLFPIDGILLVMFLGAVAGLAVFKFVLKLKRYIGELIMHACMGCGPLASALFLALNFLFHGPVQDITYPYDGDGHGIFTIHREDMAPGGKLHIFQPYHRMLKVEGTDIPEDLDAMGEITIHFYVADGLFGIKIFLGKELT